jgi:hypothetical protein
MPFFLEDHFWHPPYMWEDIKDIVATAKTIANHKNSNKHARKNIDKHARGNFKAWPSCIVYTHEYECTARLLLTLNKTNKVFSWVLSWAATMLNGRRVWLYMDKPAKVRLNTSNVGDMNVKN